MVPPCSDRVSRAPPYSRISFKLRIRGCHPLRPDFPDRSASLKKTTGLLRFRSPLLAESPLMSVPPGTEMFQFPGFASPHYGFMRRYPCGWVAPFGYPRINACSRLPMAFRSVPRPSSPPGAKASTECPSLAQTKPTLHRNNQHMVMPDRQSSTQHIHINASEPCNDAALGLARAKPGQTTHATPSRTTHIPRRSRKHRVVLRVQKRTRT